jgi:hypothetical protein
MYFWECAFRKVGEQVQVAIFVYRVQRKSLNTPAWTPAAVYADSTGNSDMVPLLRTVNLGDTYLPFGPWTVGLDGRRDDTQIPGGETGDAFEAGNPDFDWQRRGQYLLDQYGTLHRVLSGRDSTESTLTLTTPVPAPMVVAQLDRLDLDVDGVTDDPQMFTASTILPALAMGNMSRKIDYPTGLMRSDSQHPVVDRLWYLPSDVQTEDGMTYQLIPVYATVGNL